MWLIRHYWVVAMGGGTCTLVKKHNPKISCTATED
jgi:hypothetical protein